MKSKELVSSYRLTHWAGVLQARNTSGKSIREYCKTAGIQENTFYYWQRKLRETACEEFAARTQSEAVKPERTMVPSGWAVCKVAESAAEWKSMVVEVNGCRVHVEPDAAPEQLLKVFRVLRSL